MPSCKPARATFTPPGSTVASSSRPAPATSIAEQTGEGDVKAQTGSGNIELKDIHGGLHAGTGSGDIKITGCPRCDWKLETGSGSVEFWPGKRRVHPGCVHRFRQRAHRSRNGGPGLVRPSPHHRQGQRRRPHSPHRNRLRRRPHSLRATEKVRFINAVILSDRSAAKEAKDLRSLFAMQQENGFPLLFRLFPGERVENHEHQISRRHHRPLKKFVPQARSLSSSGRASPAFFPPPILLLPLLLLFPTPYSLLLISTRK